MSNRDEKVSEVMERTKNHVLQLEFDFCLTLVKRTEIDDSEKQDGAKEKKGMEAEHLPACEEKGIRAAEVGADKSKEPELF